MCGDEAVSAELMEKGLYEVYCGGLADYTAAAGPVAPRMVKRGLLHRHLSEGFGLFLLLGLIGIDEAWLAMEDC